MCYRHPNGTSSLLKHPGVLCGSVDQTIMQVFGGIMLAFMVTFFVSCSWAAWHIPQWIFQETGSDLACKGLRWRHRGTQGVAFLVSRFRPDRWWWGLPLLLRGTLLSLCLVAAPELPPAQHAMMTVVILSFLLGQARSYNCRLDSWKRGIREVWTSTGGVGWQ